MKNYVVGPWVINKGKYFIGPKLKVIKAPLKNLKSISKKDLNYLEDLQFIINTTSLLKFTEFFINDIAYKDEVCSKENFCWLWVTDKIFLSSAYSISLSLNSRVVDFTFKVTTKKQQIVKHLQNNRQKFSRYLIIPFSNNEPISNRAIHKKFGDLFNVEILWMGECLEGMHLGPIVKFPDCLNDYKKCIQEWSSTKNLFSLGFKDYWPLSLHNSIANYKEIFICAIIKLIQYSSYTGSCILVETNNEVKIWTALKRFSVSEAEFFKTQLWSKGLIKGFKTCRLELFKNIFISECKSPSRGIDYLEGNSGKGFTSKSATYSAIGEAIERFSALEANCLPSEIKDKDTYKLYTLDQFHPFGHKWEKYLASGKHFIPLQLVKNELEENDFVYVPECLIPFPYLPTLPNYDVTTSSTSGLAVYHNYDEAVIKGTLEILERNNFYPSFLNLKDGFQLDIFSLCSINHPNYMTLCQNLKLLKGMSIEVWFILYKDYFNLPIIHCFLLDKINHFFSRGSGSGYTWYTAIEKAFLEALQIRQQFLTFKDNPVSLAYINWCKEEVIQEILSYISSFHSIKLDMSETYTKDELLIKIKKILRTLQKPLLVARLPKIINNWDSVRVLIPTLTTHQYPSYSEGGKSLLNPSFIYGVPS